MATPTPEDIAGWPEPNYDNPETRAALVVGVHIGTTIVMVIFLSVRLYTKSFLKNATGADDYVMAIAGVTALAMGVIGALSTKYGGGHHIWDLKDEWATPYGKLSLAEDTLFPTCVSLTKISICITYLRLFPSRSNRIFCWTCIVYLTLWMISVSIMNILQCIPIKGMYDPSVTEKKCIDYKSALLSTAALNSVSDFIVYLWPAKPLWRVQLPLKQRIGLLGVFCMGCIVCIAGVCRMYYLEEYFKTYDGLYIGGIVWVTLAIEFNIGIVAGCLPSVKPLLNKLFPRFFQSSSGGTTHPSRTANPHSQGFPFHSLSGGTRTNKATARISEGDLTGTQSYAWAVAKKTGVLVEEDEIPMGGIAVTSSVTVDPGTRPGSIAKQPDNNSEEWIIPPQADQGHL